jgi:NTE family protein
MVEWAASERSFLFEPSELSTYDRKAVGLSFSGGGYRATLFHAGAVLRYNELGVLGRASRISSVSGGSITTGLLAKAWPSLNFGPNGIASTGSIREQFLAPVLEATARTLDVRVGLAGFLPFVSAGNRLADLYDRFVFDGLKLNRIPSKPKFIFNATNLQTQGLFRFTKAYLADWRGVMSTTHTIRLADAVAASSAFPPVLAPLRLDLREEETHAPAGARWDDPAIRKEPILVDGGVYDNLGLEAIWKRCGVLITSYAGHNAAAEASNFTIDHMLPVVNAFLAASIDWRERMLVAMFKRKLEDGLPERLGAYWTAGTRLQDFPRHDGWKPTHEEMERARLLPTRLEAMSRDDQVVAIRAGYALADAGIRSYLLPDAPAPSEAPI